MPSRIPAGSRIGPYVVRSPLGRGGMAQVYLAFHEGLNKPVAIKFMAPQLIEDSSYLARFKREVAVLARLDHPNVVPIHDIGEFDGLPFLVMPFVTGGTLATRIRTGLSLRQTLRIAAQIADALEYAHGQGVFHRDLKPANILMARSEFPLIADFGIARLAGDTTITVAGSLVGTPHYMSPEQALGKLVDGRTDVYALGVIAYEMLAGRPPFDGDSGHAIIYQHIAVPPPPLRKHRAEIPEALDDVVNRALAKDPADRFQSAAAFRDAIEASDQQIQVDDGSQSQPIAPTQIMSVPTTHVPNPAVRPGPPVDEPLLRGATTGDESRIAEDESERIPIDTPSAEPSEVLLGNEGSGALEAVGSDQSHSLGDVSYWTPSLAVFETEPTTRSGGHRGTQIILVSLIVGLILLGVALGSLALDRKAPPPVIILVVATPIAVLIGGLWFRFRSRASS